MKKSLKIISLFILSFLVLSCYKDKGNYDYTTDKVAITVFGAKKPNTAFNSKASAVFKIGQEVSIAANYHLIDSTITPNDLGFEWIMGNKSVGTDSVITLQETKVGEYNGILVVTDKRYNQKYQSLFEFHVEPLYVNGWYIGSTKDDETRISYMTLEVEKQEDKDPINKFNLEEDIFAKANKNFKIAGNALGMRTHIYGFGVSALSIVQPNGLGAIDVSCNSMQVLGNANKDFISKPQGEIIDIIYSYDTEYAGVFALDDHGGVYTREELINTSTIVPHVTFFPSEPITIKGDIKVTQWVNTTPLASPFVGSYHSIPAYDELNNRLVRITKETIVPYNREFFPVEGKVPHLDGPGWDGKKEYEDITFPNLWDFKDYTVVKMCGGGWSLAGSWDFPQLPSICLLLKRKSDNKLFFNTFRIKDDNGDVEITLDLFFPVPDGIDIDPETMLTENTFGDETQAVYFTTRGNKEIYYFDLVKGVDLLKKIYTSDKPITAMGTGENGNLAPAWGGEYTPYHGKMVVATEDGTLKVITIDDDAIATGSKVLYETKTNVGKITHIMYNSNVLANI